MDALGMHIYPTSTLSDGTIVWAPAQFEQTLGQVRAVRVEYGGTQPIWVTEAGESTGIEADAPAAATPAEQASGLITMINEARADGDVGMLLVHTIQDTPNTPSDPFNGIDQGWGPSRRPARRRRSPVLSRPSSGARFNAANANPAAAFSSSASNHYRSPGPSPRGKSR